MTESNSGFDRLKTPPVQPSRSFLPGAEDIAGECIPSSEHVVNEQNRFDRREAVAVGRAAREPV
jgi:hypothetical protein